MPSRVVDRQWLYPFYVIAILSLVLLLFGCDEQGAETFSVEIRVENETGSPIKEATVGVRPCFESGEGVRCSGQLFSGRAQSVRGTAVELTGWDVRVDGRTAILTWTTASETNNAEFEIEKEREGIGGFKQIGSVDGQGTTQETHNYTYRDENLSVEEHTYRLIAVETDGTTSIVGEPETIRVRTSIDPSIRPLFPNPMQQGAVFGVAVSERSILTSTVHTLDGERVRTIVQETIQSGRHRRSWIVGDVPGGIYEHRTRVEANGEVVARDTTYAVVVGSSPLGTTADDGTVSTTDRTRFPAFYNVPPIEIRDPEEVVRGTLRVAPSVEFVVVVNGERHAFRRTVSEGENTLTLSTDS
jgi:hypothetical protein